MVENFADDNLFPDETFKTDFERNSALSSYFYDVTNPELKLPPSVNFIALRETVLAEASFIFPRNKLFWKKWIDSPQFLAILSALVIRVMDCMTENGHLNFTKLMQRKGSPVIEKLSLNIAEMIVKSKPKHGNSQDMLFL
eukprot:gene22787-29503_t